MKKMMLVSICLVALISCGDIEIRPDSPVVGAQEAGVEPVLFLGTDANRGECPAVYGRKAPGLCVRNTELVLVSVEVPDGSCRNILLSEAPQNAKTVNLSYAPRLVALNSIGLSQAVTVFYSDSGCNNNYLTLSQYAYEFVATASGTHIGGVRVPVPHVPIVNGRLYYRAFVGDGFQSYAIVMNGFTD